MNCVCIETPVSRQSKLVGVYREKGHSDIIVGSRGNVV